MIGYELAGRDEYFVGKLGKVYSVSELLNGIEKPEKRQYGNIFVNGDYVQEKKVAEINQTISGTVHGSVLAAKTITNCLNTVQSQADSEIKQLLTDLLKQIEELNSKVPAEKSQDIEQISRDAEDLVNEVNSDKPRKRNSQFSLEGIKEAAIKLGETAKPIIEIAEKISPFLLGF